VPSYIVSSQLFNNRSIFISQLEFLGMSYQQSAITQSLQKTGVMALMQPVNDSSLSLSNNSSLPRFTYQATLSEVYDVLKVSRSGSVLIIDPAQIKPIGMIDWEDLHSYLFKQQY
jgi:chloride channel protein, CIC family